MTPRRICSRPAPLVLALCLVGGWTRSSAAEQPRATTKAAAPAAQQNPTTALFAHVAIGGGFSTVFTLLNTGNDTLVGNLVLTRSDGIPLVAALEFSSPAGAVSASTAEVVIPPGGVRIVEARAQVNQDAPTAGWARVESTGGALGGVATFQLESESRLISIAGVLSAEQTHVATIPAIDDIREGRYTGYAAANHGSSNIFVRIVMVNADGTIRQTLRPPMLNPLEPGRQIARFLFQDVNDPEFKFQGSMILIADDDRDFSVVALVQSEGAAGPLYTAIPVIPSKTPGIN